VFLAATLVVAFVASGQSAVVSPHARVAAGRAVKGVPPSAANLWLDGGSGRCRRSASPGAYAPAAACGSIGAAYAACQPGDTVRIKQGTYGDQRIAGAKSAPGCAFVAERGTTISRLDVAASWFEIDGATIGNYGWNLPNPLPSHVTFRNIATTSEVFMKGGSDISIIGGSVGGFCSNGAPAAMHLEGDQATGTTLTNVLVDGVLFHDITRCPTSDHYEAIRIDTNASSVTIRDSRFVNAGVNSALVFITNTDGGSGDPHDITIENNFFGSTPEAFYAINMNAVVQVCTNLKIDYNSFGGSPTALQCATKTNVMLVGNLGSKGNSCEEGAVYRSNVWQAPSNAVKCDPSDRWVPGAQYSIDHLGFVDPGSGDFHLLPGSPALGRGDLTVRPLADIEGHARPLRVAADAGAVQLEPASIVLGRTLGEIQIGEMQPQVRAFYGAPSRVSHVPLGKGGPKVELDRYRRHGGVLWVAYAAQQVVAVGTTSPYYSTAAGLGVGASTSDPNVRPALGRHACPLSYRRSVGPTIVTLGVRGATISSLWVTRPQYAGSAACP
jgi:hypothetical protein